MTDRPGLDFSFSGLKTHTRNLWLNGDQQDQTRADICAGFQLAVVDTVRGKVVARHSVPAHNIRGLALNQYQCLYPPSAGLGVVRNRTDAV